MAGHTAGAVSRFRDALRGPQDRKASLRRKAATAAATALALGMGYVVMFGHNGLTAYAHKRAEASDLTHQMQQLQVENGRLQEHVNHLENDPGAIEHQAREELHYTRAGEVIYTLPGPTAATAPVPAAAQ